MQRPDDRTDDALSRAFEDFRRQARTMVTPRGAGAAQEAARGRRRTRLVGAVAVLAALLFGGGGYLIGAGANPGEPYPPGGVPVSGYSPGAPTPSGSTPAGGQPGGTAPPAPDRCHTSDLSARLYEQVSAGASGQVTALLGLTNTSARPCRMYGYPGMRLIDAAGGWLPTTVIWDPAHKPILFTLDPGGTGWAKLAWAQSGGPAATASPAASASAVATPAAGGSPEPPACVSGAGLRVTPPDETTQLEVPARLVVCGGGRITAGPMSPAPPTG